MCPNGLQLNTHETILKIKSPANVLAKGGSGTAVPFTLSPIYESIESDQLAAEAEANYNSGKSMFYKHCTLVKSFRVTASSTTFHETVNLPRKSLWNIVMFFQRATYESETLYYPAITSVKISFQGQPNYIYTQQFKKHDFFDETSRVTPLLPLLGVITGGLTTSKHVFNHLYGKVDDAAARGPFRDGEGVRNPESN